MAKKSVLLVDDDAGFVDAVSAVLETRYEVRTAANGREALAAIAATPPDIVVLDVMMDHLSEGFDVARALRSSEASRAIPIVMLTGVDEVLQHPHGDRRSRFLRPLPAETRRPRNAPRDSRRTAG